MEERTCYDSGAFPKRSGSVRQTCTSTQQCLREGPTAAGALTLCLHPECAGPHAKVLTLIAAAGISRLANRPKIPGWCKALAARFSAKATLDLL